MSNIDKRALREVAERATPGNWRRTSSLFNGITVTPFSLCGEEVTLAHAVEKRDAEFIAAANRATMLALLDEWEADKEQIKALESRNRRLDGIIDAAEKRVAELESIATDYGLKFQKAQDALKHQTLLHKSQMEAAENNLIDSECHVAELEEALRDKQALLDTAEKRIAEQQTENAYIRNRYKELDLLIGKNILVMQAAIIEWQATGDAKNGLAWIYNTLFGPGELPDETEKDAQAYFDRKYAPIDKELMALHKWFCEQNEAERAAAGIGVKQQQDSVDSGVGSRNQPGMVVAVHIDAGDFVKVKGQVFEVEETDFDDHDVTLWFVGGDALKCSAGCPVEVVSEPVTAGIKVKGE